MSGERRNGQQKRRLHRGLASELGIQFLLIPAVGAGLLFLANFIWAHR